MTVFLPSGYNRIVWTWTLDGSLKIFQTVMMFNNGSSASASQLSSAYRSAFIASSRPFAAANMFVGYTLAKTEVTRNDSGVVTQYIDESPTVGTKAGSLGTPINTSILMKKVTNLVGRKYQGRLMLPNLYVPESDVSQAGIIVGATAAAYTGLFTSAMNDLATGAFGVTGRLGHSSSEVLPTPCTYSTVLKIGTIKRRIRGY